MSNIDSHTLFGAAYWEPGAKASVQAEKADLYFFQSYIGPHTLTVAFGDCIFWLADDLHTAFLNRGSVTINSPHLATVIRGYMPENKSSGLATGTYLPYVNGCSTKQVFPPERLGDPTLQTLYIPPFCSEQVHHIHSTVRVVYVLAGQGTSIVGMKNQHRREALYPGKVVILQKMCPHHFETAQDSLTVLPLHVFSATGPQEMNHPMFNGTHLLT